MAIALMTGATGCSVDTLEIEQEESLKIVFEASPFVDGDGDADTRTSVIPNETYSNYEFIWSAKDTVGIYPDAGSQIFFTMENGAGASSATFDGGAWTCKEGHEYRSYFPFIANYYLDKTKIPVTFLGQKQVGNDNSDHFQKYDYMYTAATTKDSGFLNFSYSHLITAVLPWVELPAGHYTGLTLSLDEPLFVTEGEYDLTAATPAIVGKKFSDSMSIELDVTFTSPDILKVYVPLAPMDMSGKTLIITITNENGKEFQYTYEPSKPYAASKIYRLRSATSFVDVTIIDEYEYVDLGLSVFWAAHNIGASKPEKVGGSFAWAYTSPSDDTNYYDYKYGEYDDSYEDSYLTKYCYRSDDGLYGFVDNLRVLLPEDDAAYVLWGNHWRMPKKQEFNELITMCTWSETPTGYIVTGPNGNSIFLPWREKREDGSYFYPHNGGSYWSSSLSQDDQVSSWNAVLLEKNRLSYNSRIFAYYIRPVCVSTNSVTSVTLDKTSLTLTIGANGYLTATVIPSNVTNNTVTWTSSDPSVATVSRSGVVTAKAAGAATISAECCGVSATCDVTVREVDVTNISLSETTLELNISGTSTADIVLNLSPSNAFNNPITWTSGDPSIATVTAVVMYSYGQVIRCGRITAKSIGTTTITVECGGKSATCYVTVINPEFVDLGLSVKWATCNFGANAPEEYGNYYAWGEIETKSYYAWSTNRYGNNDNGGHLYKYNTDSSLGTIDNKTILETGDDVASYYYGGKWRMPTNEDWTELRTNCSWTQTTRNGVPGRLVTANNGNSIFLPAAGYMNGTTLYDVSRGKYWSSSLYTSYPFCANSVYFDSSEVGWTFDFRCYGLTIRPVLEQ